MRRTICIFALLCACMHSQDLVSHAGISGSIVDPANRPVPGASVTLRDPARGTALQVRSAQDGQYRIPLLNPGTYQLTVEAKGFEVLNERDIEIRVGDLVVVNCHLSEAAQRIVVEVAARAPAIDFQRTQQATFLEAARLDQLPINQRNYLTFALLSPGVMATGDMADAANFRIPTTPDSGLGFSGGNGRGNIFAVDGFSNNGTTGNVRPSLPQDAVQEFQVQRNSYSAELGGGYGGAINIISRSGSNQVHGSAFAYLRNRALDARNYFDPAKSAFTRVQSGAALGGPLRKDRTFFYGAFERLDRHETTFVPILSNQAVLGQLQPSQTALIQFLQGSKNPQYAGMGALLPALLTPTLNPAVNALFHNNSGVFPFRAGITQAMVRVDHRFSDRDSLLLRMNLTDHSEQNTQFGALIGENRGSSTYEPDRTVGLEFTHIFSPHWTSLTRASYSYSRLLYNPNDGIGPAVDILGYGSFGRNPQYPSDARYRIGQLQQEFSWTGSRHSVKFGGEYFPANSAGRLETYFGGQFIFGEIIPLGLLLNSVAQDPNFATNLGGAIAASGQSSLLSSLSAPINSLQAYSLGLPEAYVQGFGNPYSSGTQQRASFFAEDTFRPVPNLSLNYGLRYQYDDFKDTPTMKTWGPRFGFAWSPRNSEKLVLRGGFGIYHSFIESFITYSATAFQRTDLSVLFVTLGGVPGVNNPQTGQPVTSADVYLSLLSRGILGTRPIAYSDLTPLGVGPALKFPLTGGVSRDYRNPYTEQGSFEVERAFHDTAFSASWNYVHGLRLPRTRDVNLKLMGTQPDGRPILGPIDPTLIHNYVLESAAKSFYNALTLQANRRLLDHFSLQAHYTLSHATDEVTDYPPDYAPDNQLNARADRGLSAFNAKHRFVANAVVDYKGWSFAPIVSAHSGLPFNIITGTDTVGDGEVNTHRPVGAGRNIGHGPDSFGIDARLARAFALAHEGRLRMVVTAEAFNILNRTNFLTVNNVVGNLPLSALPRQIAGMRGDPTDPLSFTSASDPRQIQFGMKLQF